MFKVLVTGSAGFIGSHLINALSREENIALFQYDIHNSIDDLEAALREADIIYHLAGVNRPPNESEFSTVNAGLTQQICDFLQDIGRSPRIVFSSSIQAENDNHYGRSKKAAEEVLQKYHEKTGAGTLIYRLPGVFGKWSRPNYNTVVATFCYNIARDLPIQISNKTNELKLVYIDDIINTFISDLKQELNADGFRFAEVHPVHSITLGKLVETLESFRKSRETLILPDMSDPFTVKLYAAYLSFLPENDFSYQLHKWEDERGALAEFIKSPSIGQIFVSRTKPGITRGNHYHHTKVEKFLVMEGKGSIRFRHINGDEVLNYNVDGRDFKVVDIPPGYTHSIENTGKENMICLFWSSEIFNPEKPDTYYEEV